MQTQGPSESQINRPVISTAEMPVEEVSAIEAATKIGIEVAGIKRLFTGLWIERLSALSIRATDDLSSQDLQALSQAILELKSLVESLHRDSTNTNLSAWFHDVNNKITIMCGHISLFEETPFEADLQPLKELIDKTTKLIAYCHSINKVSMETRRGIAVEAALKMFKDKSVLVVENEEGVISLLERRLKEAEAMVVSASSLEEARAAILKGGYDVILLDDNLGSGTFGHQLKDHILALKELNPNLKVILHSSNAASIEIGQQSSYDFVDGKASKADYPAMTEVLLGTD